MCGFVGINEKTKLIQTALDKIRYRGPDSQNVTYLKFGENISFSLGHARLAFQDLDDRASQPMQSKHAYIVFNGEIYNFKVIRNELLKLGHTFRTNSDTEVILESYLEWGVSCIDRFEGMFAFVIIDQDTEQVILCRDRFGIKPLYFLNDEKRFIFSSEMQCIRTFAELDISRTAVQQFLKFGYILQPNTIFENVQQVGAGSYVILDLKTFSSVQRKYWCLETLYEKCRGKRSVFKTYMNNFPAMLQTAVHSRLLADVPVGVCLSGGYDSSLTALLAKSYYSEKIKTFTVGFDDAAYDERFAAREFAELIQSEHYELLSDQQDIAKVIASIISNSGEPISDSSIIPTYQLFKLISANSKAALSADGGDELFSGYDVYKKALFVKKINKLFSYPIKFLVNLPAPEPLILMLKKILKYKNLNSGSEFINAARTIFSEKDIFILMGDSDHRALNPKVTCSLSFLDEMQIHDALHYQQSSVLVKVDRMSMLNSVEAREPFLNRELQEFGFGLHPWRKLNFFGQKRPLRRFAKTQLKSNILNRPKRGFGSPVDQWLKDKFYKHFVETLCNKKISDALKINHAEITKIIANFNQDPQAARKAWVAYMLYYWAQEHLVLESSTPP